MGTGKSEVGKLLARELSIGFIDTDEEIEKRSGTSIPDIFRNKGEEYFRHLETKELERVINLADNLVVATGGGIVISSYNRKIIKEQTIPILLKASPEVIYERVKDSNRPLLEVVNPLDKIKKLLNERSLYYNEFELQIETDHREPEEIVREITGIINELNRFVKGRVTMEPRKLVIDIKEKRKQYPILIGCNIINQLAQKVTEIYNGDKILIVTDDNVRELYGEKVFSNLTSKGYEVSLFSIIPGEKSKSYQSLLKGHDILVENNFKRNNLIIALGGGVVGDLAGFMAATYMRGIPFIQIPTTLLSQVDSSVGGKTAINHDAGKNLIGAFYQPLMVLIDPGFLKTLPVRELKTGLVEVIKHGFIADPEMVEFLLENREDIYRINEQALTYLIENSCKIKSAIVSKDEKEKGQRALLNFGHTIGHALEAVTAYQRYNHGEAVAIGMVGAARLSKELGYLSAGELAIIEKTISLYNLPLTYQYGEKVAEVFERLFFDKKVRDKTVRWVLLDKIGQAFIEEGIEYSLVNKVLEGLV
jgi:3-dehydroquinate synthase